MKACQAHEINRRFRVAVALEHTVRLRHKRKHMPWPAKIGRLRVWVDHLARRKTTLFSGDARSGIHVIDRDRERRFVVVGVLDDHLRELQLLAKIDAHRHADETLAVHRHEVHVFGGGELGRTDEIALVLTIWIVGAEDNLTLAQVFECFFDGVEFEHACSFLSQTNVLTYSLKPIHQQKIFGDPLRVLGRRTAWRTKGKQPVHILADHIGFQVDLITHAFLRQIRFGARMRNH